MIALKTAWRPLAAVATVVGSWLIAAPAADAAIVTYYIARDARQTIPESGAPPMPGAPGTTNYGGLANPNYNRLTFLLSHGDHYHAKSPYTYYGPNAGAATAVQPFNGSAAGVPGNYLPEGATAAPFAMEQAGGVWGNKWRTPAQPTPGGTYPDFRIKSVDDLATYPAGSPEQILLTSGGTSPAGRFAGSLAGSNLRLTLVSASPGMGVYDSSGNALITSTGGSHNLGNGSTVDFTPVLAMPAGTAAGNYFATFTLTDTGTGNAGGPWLDSGQFTFNVSVPEPSSLMLLPVGLLALASRRRRRAI